MSPDEARKRAGLSTTELAARAGVAEPTVRDYETGRRFPAQWRARQIERLLGCKPGEIEWPSPLPADEDAAAAGD